MFKLLAHYALWTRMRQRFQKVLYCFQKAFNEFCPCHPRVGHRGKGRDGSHSSFYFSRVFFLRKLSSSLSLFLRFFLSNKQSSQFVIVGVWVRTVYHYRCFKQLSWSVSVVESLLILASSKHYTVDVVVAWYTVNLVVFFIDQKLPELPDRSTCQPLLPLSTREKDSKNREELDKFLNGDSANITI